MNIERRQFLRQSLVLASSLALGATHRAHDLSGQIMTIRGPIPASKLGLALAYEHVVVDCSGNEISPKPRYDQQEAFDLAIPPLQWFRSLGGRAVVDATPAFRGRNPLLLKRLSEVADIHLLTNTGYDGSQQHKFLPKHAADESERQLAGRWIKECREGIDQTGIRPGFIKTGADTGMLTDLQVKLTLGAALAHAATGLPIAAGAPDEFGARQQLDILTREGVAPEAFIWVQEQLLPEPASLELAERGAWIQIACLSEKNIKTVSTYLIEFKKRSLLNRLLISHGDGWMRDESGFKRIDNGNNLPYDTLLRRLAPLMAPPLFSAEDFRLLAVENPRRAFALRKPSA